MKLWEKVTGLERVSGSIIDHRTAIAGARICTRSVCDLLATGRATSFSQATLSLQDGGRLTVEDKNQSAFGIWITGLPASGKSTVTTLLQTQLRARGVDVAVLESDTLRRTFTPNPRYDEEERDTFYQQLADVGALLTAQGVPVIFDATANRRVYRDRARRLIPHFLEIYVDCPLETCVARDPKGIYRQPQNGLPAQVSELQTEYEAPQNPELVVRCESESPDSAAGRVVALLMEKGYIR